MSGELLFLAGAAASTVHDPLDVLEQGAVGQWRGDDVGGDQGDAVLGPVGASRRVRGGPAGGGAAAPWPPTTPCRPGPLLGQALAIFQQIGAVEARTCSPNWTPSRPTSG